ncbi:hypothetical protein V2A84_00445 [Yersinia sp. 2553 StPb PI]|uniref:hypothetical protein n=1 Tax=Yersinia sp. 2553 StPb PI TaxID=3117411 RepID=UPI003FA4C199
MFNFKRKSLSLSQLKRKKRDINKAIEITHVFSLKILFIAIAFIIASIGIKISYNVEFLALINNQEMTHRDVINILYVTSPIFHLMGLGLASSATILWVSNIYAYHSLRKITQTIETRAVREEIQHAE